MFILYPVDRHSKKIQVKQYCKYELSFPPVVLTEKEYLVTLSYLRNQDKLQ
jgi:hypothetical protein